ncbi:uncharacterized protein L3040_003072 [Drepanopeziza brunnea f. sp. 'multigermtubi']|uniref:uncharacterized protein n=1 Tax=Drepanopeziza brunnea f. sp. 'multigermtubi' TaxID=698441 RepID=UPI0023871978|nr:hypothetical protein L3040_003072 [Drepanopeziza brunnea f. sp. 'multigermtubi']
MSGARDLASPVSPIDSANEEETPTDHVREPSLRGPPAGPARLYTETTRPGRFRTTPLAPVPVSTASRGLGLGLGLHSDAGSTSPAWEDTLEALEEPSIPPPTAQAASGPLLDPAAQVLLSYPPGTSAETRSGSSSLVQGTVGGWELFEASSLPSADRGSDPFPPSGRPARASTGLSTAREMALPETLRLDSVPSSSILSTGWQLSTPPTRPWRARNPPSDSPSWRQKGYLVICLEDLGQDELASSGSTRFPGWTFEEFDLERYTKVRNSQNPNPMFPRNAIPHLRRGLSVEKRITYISGSPSEAFFRTLRPVLTGLAGYLLSHQPGGADRLGRVNHRASAESIYDIMTDGPPVTGPSNSATPPAHRFIEVVLGAGESATDFVTGIIANPPPIPQIAEAGARGAPGAPATRGSSTFGANAPWVPGRRSVYDVVPGSQPAFPSQPRPNRSPPGNDETAETVPRLLGDLGVAIEAALAAAAVLNGAERDRVRPIGPVTQPVANTGGNPLENGAAQPPDRTSGGTAAANGRAGPRRRTALAAAQALASGNTVNGHTMLAQATGTTASASGASGSSALVENDIGALIAPINALRNEVRNQARVASFWHMMSCSLHAIVLIAVYGLVRRLFGWE